MNGVLKIKWLQSLLGNNNQPWFSLSSAVFENYVILSFYVIIITQTACQTYCRPPAGLIVLKIINKHNFSPHNMPLWNRRVVLWKRKRKYMFMKDWWKKNMVNSAPTLEIWEFITKYNLECSVKDYTRLTQRKPFSVN